MPEETPDPAARLLAEAERLREEAARLHEAAREATDEGDRRLEIAAQLEALAGGRGLSTGNRRGNLPVDVLPTQRLARGRSLVKTRGGGSDLVSACHKAGITLRQLGAEVGVSHSFLSACAAGRKHVPDAVRAAVAKRIGWSDWPKS